MIASIDRAYIQSLFQANRLEDIAIYVYTTVKKFNKESNAFTYICSIDELNEQLSKLQAVNFLFSVKSNITTNTEGGNQASSRILEQANINLAPSSVTPDMQNIGGLLVGKNNCDEFACGIDGTTSCHGVSLVDGKNPGGSSSGGSASVPYVADIALGTDTGGSCRMTSCTTRVSIGFKPTFGAISRHGTIQYADSFDTIGFMYNRARSDVAENVFKKIRNNNKDSCSIAYTDQDDEQAQYPNIAILTCPQSNLSNIINILDKAHIVKQIPALKMSLFQIGAAYGILTCCEFFSSLTKFNPIRYRTDNIKYHETAQIGHDRFQYLNKMAKAKVLTGACILGIKDNRNLYYQAINTRQQIIENMLEIFQTYDFLIVPAPNLSEITNEELESYYFLANLVGLPAITITINNVGITVMGRRKKDVPLIKFVNNIIKLCQKKSII